MLRKIAHLSLIYLLGLSKRVIFQLPCLVPWGDIYIYIHIFKYIHIYIYIHIYVYIYSYVYIYIVLYLNLYTYIYIHIYIYICIHIYLSPRPWQKAHPFSVQDAKRTRVAWYQLWRHQRMPGTHRWKNPGDSVILFQQNINVGPPSDVRWFINPMKTIVIGTINHSYWCYWHQLSYQWEFQDPKMKVR